MDSFRTGARGPSPKEPPARASERWLGGGHQQPGHTPRRCNAEARGDCDRLGWPVNPARKELLAGPPLPIRKPHVGRLWSPHIFPGRPVLGSLSPSLQPRQRGEQLPESWRPGEPARAGRPTEGVQLVLTEPGRGMADTQVRGMPRETHTAQVTSTGPTFGATSASSSSAPSSSPSSSCTGTRHNQPASHEPLRAYRSRSGENPGHQEPRATQVGSKQTFLEQTSTGQWQAGGCSCTGHSRESLREAGAI